MAYSLFLGTGPAGQLEIFSVLCKEYIIKGMPLEKAVNESYLAMKEAVGQVRARGFNPFPGYVTGGDLEQSFAKFHPLSLYAEYARIAMPCLEYPIIAVEARPMAVESFCRLVETLELNDKIVPKNMALISCPYTESRWQAAGVTLPDVSGLIAEWGFPSLIAGSHFLSIGAHWCTETYSGMQVHRKIPHSALTPLMEDNAMLAFLEEGDLIFDEGVTYEAAICGKPEEQRGIAGNARRNGLHAFEWWAGTFFHSADAAGRKFRVEVMPKGFISEYDRKQADYGQVLVTVQALARATNQKAL